MGNSKHECGQRVLGADVSLEKFDAGVAGPDSAADLRSIKVRIFPRTLEGVRLCLDWVDALGGIDSVVMEATGYYSQELAGWFAQLRPDLPVFIANAFPIKRFGESLGVRTKTDSQDARVIACFGVGRKLWPLHQKPPALRELDRLHKDRDALVDMLKNVRQRALGAARNGAAHAVHTRICAELKKGIGDLEIAIMALVQQTPSIKDDAQLLQTIPGVGFHTATKVLASIGDMRRFNRARELAAFEGVAPREKLSGKTVHGRTVMCKKGDPRVRSALYMAALAAVRKGPFQEIYLKLRARGAKAKSALGAIMRRILLLMRVLLKSGQAFDPSKVGKSPVQAG